MKQLNKIQLKECHFKPFKQTKYNTRSQSDQGLQNLTGSNEEMITTGLDNLESRLIEYKKIGCEFVKWRAVLVSDQISPLKIVSIPILDY
ncbi:MAG: hypothetical protein CM1200mP37_1890 [Chloroflexota bacterium]|nr:MAG: hypothetical protein CM1200mP37_1890 [Chloroflexota bacterium]